jgi:hypothetical protein
MMPFIATGLDELSLKKRMSNKNKYKRFEELGAM